MSANEMPERHADTERNKIINRASSDLEQIINGHDPEIHHLGNRVWDRLDKMAVDIENHRSDLCAAGQQVMSGNPKMEKSALERLAELRREVTDEPLHVSGRYFNSHSCTDLTRCGYGGTGEFWNPADGEAISILWGLWRDGAFDTMTPTPEAERDAIVAAMVEAAADILDTHGDNTATEALGQRLCCNGQMCGCRGASFGEYLQHLIRALTPADALAKLDQIGAKERAAGRREGMPSVDDLAQIIRRVDGDNSKGAGELAEAIVAAMEKEHGK